MATAKRSRKGSGKSSTSRSGGTAASKPASRTSSAANGAAKKRTQSAKTRAAGSAAKTARSSSNGTKRTQSKASSNGATRSANGSARTSRARSTSSASSRNGARSTAAHARSTAAHVQDGMVGKLKQTGTAVRQAADRAGRPTITVAAAMAGLAGGLALRQRHTAVHDGLTTRSMAMLHDVDAAALIGGLGKATVQLSQRSKNVARDIERVAEQAERLGKILS